jgi:glycosyltransferase involved in cell wall biosynthesis
MSRRLRIAHVSVVHSLDDPRIFDRECRSLAQAGHAVWYAGIGDAMPAADHHVRLVPLARRPRARRYETTADALRVLLALRPDVVHLHDPELLLAVPWLRRRAQRIVFDMHEYLSQSMAAKPYIPPALRPAAAHGAWIAQRWLVARVDGLVAVTPEQFEDVGQRPPLRLALPNFPRRERFTGAAPALPPDDTRLRLVHIGTLSPSRGTRLMIDCLRVLGEQIQLLLGGRCATPEFEAELRAALDECPPGSLRLLGRVPPAEVPGYLASAEVIWLPELPTAQYARPTIPTKLLEGMAAGLAALVSDLPGRGEVIEAARCGAVVPPTLDGHLHGLRQLLQSRRELTDYGRRAAAIVAQRYSWESVQGSLFDFYQKLG